MYIIPRKFDMMIENVQFFTSFETLCGFAKFKVKQAFEAATAESIAEDLQSNVSMSVQDFANLKNAIVTKFLTEYEGQRVDVEGAGGQVGELTEQT